MLNHQGTVKLETGRLILREYREGEEQIIIGLLSWMEHRLEALM